MIARAPQLSVIIPTYDREALLGRCLEAFSRQTAPADQFELVIADDGCHYDVQALVDRFSGGLQIRLSSEPHQGVCAARNRAITLARAPWLILHDDDQAPLPEMVADCLAFHERRPALEDCLFLPFSLSDRLRADAVSAILFDSGLLYRFPKDAAVYDWALFWSGAISCKAALFDHGMFDPDYPMCQDTELAIRLGQIIALRIHFDGKPRSVYDRAITFREVYDREYRAAYYRGKLIATYGEQAKLGAPIYRDPRAFLAPDASMLTTTGSLIAKIEAALADRETAGRRLSDINLLIALYERALAHGIASGLLAFRAGQPPPD